MKEGFPLLTTKKMAWKTMVTELLWFLRGDTNIKYLVENGCHIWDGDAWVNYKRKVLDKFIKDTTISGHAITNQQDFINKIKTDDKFAREWGNLGPIYGKQWRNWDGKLNGGDDVYIDQIQNLINELKTNPDSRRLMVSAWNVGELDQMVLPPCHYGFQVYTRELSHTERYWLYNKISGDRCTPNCYTEEDFNKHNIPTRAISLMWNQRSVDTFLGLPFNIASYALLLEILAKAVQMIPDQLIGSLGDVHLYSNHIEQAKEQIQREPYELPTLKMNPIFLANLEHKGLDEAINGQVNFEVEGYQSHPSIKAPLSN
jgi:thymidylate synthase